MWLADQTRASSELVRKASSQPHLDPLKLQPAGSLGIWFFCWFLNKTKTKQTNTNPAVTVEALASSISGEPWKCEKAAKLRSTQRTRSGNLTEGSDSRNVLLLFKIKLEHLRVPSLPLTSTAGSIHRKKNMESQMNTWSSESGTDKVLQKNQFCSFR
jgi:hypothetical protein